MRTTDPDIVGLELDFQGLTISVRGPASSAASFVRGLDLSSASPSPSAQGYSSPIATTSHVSAQSPAGLPSTARAPVSASPCRVQAPESRSCILASFPGLPSDLADLAPSLSGSRLSGLRRAQRAWICGNWAGAVLAGRIATSIGSAQSLLLCVALPGFGNASGVHKLPAFCFRCWQP